MRYFRFVLPAVLAAAFTLSPCLAERCLAEDAWRLPAHGLQLGEKEKLDWIAARMDAGLHPKPGAPAPASFQVPAGWSFEKIQLGELTLERMINPQAATSRRVLQLHGGGYIAGLSDSYRRQAVRLAVLADAREIVMVNYRLAPRHLYPAALDDATAAWGWMLTQGGKPSDILVTGDSAGGNLALELVLRLKERGLPQPGALALLSPWASLATDFPSRTANADRDQILGRVNTVMYTAVAKPCYGGDIPLDDPRLTPLNADLAGLPPMLVQAGGRELFLDECIALMRRAVDCRVQVRLSVWPDMSHDFSLVFPELDESVASFREVRDFVEEIMGR